MENPDILHALLYVFAAAALGGLLVWLLMRLQLNAWRNQFFEQSSLLEKSQDRLKSAESKLAESQASLAAQSDSLDQMSELKASWQASEKIHAAEKRALNEWKAKAEKLETELRKTRAALTEQAVHSDPLLNGEWKARFEKTERERQALQTELTDAARREAKWHDEVLAMQAQIQRLQAQNSAVAAPIVEEKEAENASIEASVEEILKPKERNKEAFTLARIKERGKGINYDRIGYSRAEDADDLKKIKGIGPSLEKKLNSIGIFSFFQIANFEAEDEELVNEAIEFFPGRIKRDNWVAQAKEILKQNDEK
ncbi:MAG: hypothetical protein AAF927_07390 [Bacteroidota bacterium]